MTDTVVIVEGEGREAGSSRVPSIARSVSGRGTVETPKPEADNVRTAPPARPDRGGARTRRGPDPDEAARLALTRRTETAERERNVAVARANDAERIAATSIVTEREAATKLLLEAAQTALKDAKTKLRAAKEAGDYEAETDAQAQLTRAQYDIGEYTKQSADVDRDKKRIEEEAKKPAPRTGGQSITAESQRWLDEHPAFNTDKQYQQDALDAHALAIGRGNAEGSSAYVDFIDKHMERLYGEGHGQLDEAPRQHRSNGRGSSTAMPRSTNRGGNGDEGVSQGDRYADTPQGRVVAREGQDGKYRISIPDRLMEVWKEAAVWNKMPLADYAMEQIAIAEERRGGGTGGLFVETEDTAVYR